MSYKINKCPLCDSNKLHNLDNKLRNLSTYQVIKCKNCELLFLDKIYYTSQEQLDELYEEMYSEEYYKDGKNDILSNFKDKLPYQKIRKERIDSYLKQDSRVLDVGSGPGYFLEEIRYCRSLAPLMRTFLLRASLSHSSQSSINLKLELSSNPPE